MTASTPLSPAAETVTTAPTFTRRSALLATAALLAPLVPQLTVARPRPTPPPPGTILLNGNENPYGPSPAARQAIVAGLDRAPRYADATIEALANQVGAREGIPAAQVMVGSGSGELLRMAALLASTTTVVVAGTERTNDASASRVTAVPVGLLGLQTYTRLVRSVIAARIAARS